METTRQTILDILRRRQHATIDELTRLLSLAPATVRRHLDILMRDGLVQADQVRRETGRPHYLFRLTEAGEDAFPKNYVRLTNRLIEEIVALDPEETAGRSGLELADLVFERMADRLAQYYAGRITGPTLAERLKQVTHILAEEGMVFDWHETPDGFLLLGRGCPCRRVASSHSQICTHHQRLLVRLLNAEIETVEPASVGEDSYCAYRVREKAPAGAAVG